MSSNRPTSPPLAGEPALSLSKGTEGGTVPRLDLAPKLKRPLQIWNPLDYLRLLYWCFFFPQALRWYVETFADPRYREATGRDLLPALRQDRVQRNLVLQSLMLAILTPAALAAGLLRMYSWPIVAFIGALSIALGMECGILVSLRGDIARGAIFGVLFGTVLVVMSSAALLLLSLLIHYQVLVLDTTANSLLSLVGILVTFVITLVVLFYMSWFTALKMAQPMRGSKSSSIDDIGISIMTVLMILILLPAISTSMRTIADSTMNAAICILLITFFLLAVYSAIIVRLPDYFVSILYDCWVWLQGKQEKTWRISRVVSLPLPVIRKRLEAWLTHDWTTGMHNVNQLLAYTCQFIPVVQAVNTVLDQMPEDQLIAAVGELAAKPFDWDMVRFGSASLRNLIWTATISSFPIVPRLLQNRFSMELRLDTPARAACAGFWYLYQEEPTKAVSAFSVVRSLPYGKELYLGSAFLATALEVDEIAKMGRWSQISARLSQLPEPFLRPAAVHTFHRLRNIAAEADTAAHAFSPLMRSSAIGRALASLAALVEDVDNTCPQPECAIVKKVAEQWRDVLVAAGGRIGQQVLRRPIKNPYEGYSGLPVENTFAGREGILARLERLWAANINTPLPLIILYGHRRMGKTSIIHHLHRHRGPETLIARTDMQDMLMADHTGQLLLGFARAIHAAAREAGLVAGPAPGESDYASTGAARLALNALLERLDPQMSGRRLTLVVDEYEIAEEKLEKGDFDPAFLRYLRSATQRHRWLGLLFAGRQTLEDELHHYKAVFFGSAEPVRVSFLTREAALHLIRRPADDFALEYELALAEELYRLTNGQPYLLQRLCWELVNRWNDRFLKEGEETPRILTPADLEALLTPDFYHDFFLQADYYFSGVWNEAGPDEHPLLVALAAREGDRLIPRADLAREAGLPPGEAEVVIAAALRHDLVVEEDESLRLAVPLMHRWIQQQHGA